MSSLSDDELKTRLTFSALLPAVRFAARSRTSLKEVKRLVELAYYKEAKDKGLKMKEVQTFLSISMSKVGLLSKQLKEHFSGPQEEHELPRQILALLWSGPMTRVRIQQALEKSAQPRDVARTLQEMVADKRLWMTEERTPRYQLGDPQYRLVKNPWMARVDGLNDLMKVVERTIKTRFLDTDPRAMARTLTFRAKPEDIPRLQKLYEEQIFPLICELDSKVTPDEPSVPLHLSVLWTPGEDAPPSAKEEEES